MFFFFFFSPLTSETKFLPTSGAWTPISSGSKTNMNEFVAFSSEMCVEHRSPGVLQSMLLRVFGSLFNYSAGLRAVDGDGWQRCEGEDPV